MAFNANDVTNKENGAVNGKAGDATSKQKGAKFKSDGEAARAKMSEDEKALEGSKRDKVEFICCLGNPAKSQSRVEKGETKDSFEVVGYKLRLLEPMKVPNAPIKPQFAHLADVMPASWVDAPAGEIDLNVAETGMFISQIEFAGQFTGGAKPVTLTAKMSLNRPDPLPILKLIGEGSVKTGMQTIADMIGATDTNKGKPQIKPEYAEKFSVLYEKRKAVSGDGKVKAKKGEASADIAAAFRALYASKSAQ